MKKTCENCMDYVVCYAYKKLKSEEEAATCPDWQYDFMSAQNKASKKNNTK